MGDFHTQEGSMLLLQLDSSEPRRADTGEERENSPAKLAQRTLTFS